MRTIACLALLSLLIPAGGVAAPRRSRCEQTYARSFAAVRADGGKVAVRLVRYTPTGGGDVFEGAFLRCSALGTGWRVAPGSFHPSHLRALSSSASKALKSALSSCPVRYRMIDRVCAPCVAGASHCPCAERHISDWVFCEKDAG